MPLPQKDGEAVAVLALSRAYAKLGCNIDLLSFNTEKHLVDLDSLDELNHPYDNIHASYLDASINYIKAFRNLFSNKSFNIDRFRTQDFEDKLISILKENTYDFIQLESLYMASYISTIKKYSNALIVMRSHNIESQIWEDMSCQNRKPILKWYYKLCARRLEFFEEKMYGEYDLTFAISNKDAEHYSKYSNECDTHVIPVGLDSKLYDKTITDNKSNELMFGYLGSLDWTPNIEGLLWFFENVWSKIEKQYSNIEFHLAGRNPVEQIKAIDNNSLVHHGEIDSAQDFLNSLDIVVVPLFSGSGIRVKILESMAMGKLVISTNKGFEGIAIENGVHAEIANNSKEFIECMSKYLNDPGAVHSIAANARKFINKNFDYMLLAKKALKIIRVVIQVKN